MIRDGGLTHSSIEAGYQGWYAGCLVRFQAANFCPSQQLDIALHNRVKAVKASANCATKPTLDAQEVLCPLSRTLNPETQDQKA